MSLRFVLGGQVGDIESVVIEPSRLSEHDEPGRIKKLIELTVPADASNGGYAVRQLLGQDPDIGAKSVVTLEVALTQQQIEMLRNITEDELRDIRNGVNPAMIYGVRVYDSEPMDPEEFITGKRWPRWFTPSQTLKDSTGTEIICFRRDSGHSGETFCIGGKSYTWHEWKGEDLQLDEITEQEAQAIIEHSVKPTGEWLGCIQWFQHSDPNVIVQRKSRDRCTYFDRSIMTSDILWDYHMSQWVKSGEWTEITRDEAEKRIEYNRKFSGLTAQEPKPGICKREQFAGGGAPSPRNCDVCLEGPCPRVIPVQTEETDSAAMQALRKLAEQCGINPAGLNAEQMADRVIEHNQSRPYSLSCGSETCSQNGKQSDPESAFLQVPCRGCGDETQAQQQVISANVAELTKLHETVERSCQQLPANRDAVIKVSGSKATNGIAKVEFPVEHVDVPRAGIDQVSLIDKADCWNEITANNVWNKATWAARRHNFKIRCLPEHVPPARNIAVLWPEPLSAIAPDLAFVGVDYAQGPDISATVAVTTEPEQQIVELTMHSVLTPGCWVIAFSHKEHFVVEVSTEQKLNGPIPAAKLSGPIGVKFPIRHRAPVMPKDYGRQVVCRDMENFNIYDVKIGTLHGFDPVKKVFMVAEQNGRHTMYRRENEIWIIDEPTEGF